MDRVRFGRALGEGARQAAKTLMNAAEAAAAPDPNPRRQADPPPQQQRVPVYEVPYTAPQQEPPVSRPRRPSTSEVVTVGAKTLKTSFWHPFARFSSVLWLEVTGTFFALFALIGVLQVWKFHAALFLPPTAPDARRLYVYIAISLLFGYFTISSFVRAGRRQRR